MRNLPSTDLLMKVLYFRRDHFVRIFNEGIFHEGISSVSLANTQHNIDVKAKTQSREPCHVSLVFGYNPITPYRGVSLRFIDFFSYLYLTDKTLYKIGLTVDEK